MSALSQLTTNSNTEINLGPYDSGNSEYTGSLRINGNLQVNGNITYVDQLNVNDAFIQVAANNTGTVADMGLVATINANTFAGLRWDTTVGSWQTSTSVTANGEPINVYTNVVSGPPSGPDSNTQVIFADGPYDLGSSPNFTFDKDANLMTVTGESSTTGNVIAGNVLTEGFITATGNITGGNIDTAGLLTVVGNITGGNLITPGDLSADGNILTLSYFVGNGTYVTDVYASSVNADALIGQTLSSNVIYSSLTTVATLIDLSVAGSTQSGNFLTAGLISAVGTITSDSNIDGANINTTGILSAVGNAVVANIDAENHTGTTVSVTGNITAGNIDGGANVYATTHTGTSVSVAGNVTAANVNAILVSTTGNVVAGNINTSVISGANLTITATSSNLNLSSVGNIVLNNTYINALRDPVQDQDAATKNYVDNAVSAGLDIHEPVVINSDSNLSVTYTTGGTTPTWTTIATGNTITTGSAHGLSVNDVIVFGSTTNGLVAGTPYFVYSTPTATSITLSDNYNGAQITTLTNGTGLSITSQVNTGVGSYLTSTTNGPLTIEGYTFALNDRVLIVQQTDSTQNGVYYVSQVGVAGGGGSPWILTRTTDGNKYGQNSSDALDVGSYFLVTSGLNPGEAFVLTTGGTIVFGTTGLTFTKFSQTTPYTAGTGLTLNNFQFSVNADQSQITNVGTLGNLSVAGNTTTGNLLTGGIVSAGGNITGANLITSGLLTATGNVISGNINTAGMVTATGNIKGGNVIAVANVDGGNINTVGEMSAAANIITAGYFLGDGAFISNSSFAGQQIIYGLTNFTIPSVNGNIVATVNGTTNVLTIGNTFVNVNANVSVNGNITGGNIEGGSNVHAVTHTGVTVSVSANVTGGNIMTSGNVSAAGNLNVNGISLSGNINSPINTTSNITTTGNITGSYLFGNLTALNNGNSNVQIGTTNGNANISINGTANVVVVSNTGAYVTGVVSSSGNVISGNVQTSIVTASGNVIGANFNTSGLVSATGNVNGGNIISAALVQGVTLSASGNAIAGNVNTAGIVSAVGNVYGANFVSRYTDGTALSVVGSTPSAANTAGGAVSIVGGTATSAGTSSAGGAINLTAGAGHSGSNIGTGGEININAGAGTGNAAGGLTTVRGGNSGVALGGVLLMYGGNADGLQTAGNTQLSGGSLTDGVDKQGGTLTLSSGAGTGAGTESKVIIQVPTATVTGTSVQTVSNVAVFGSTGVTISGNVSSQGATYSELTVYGDAWVGNVKSRYTNGTAMYITASNVTTGSAGAMYIRGGSGNTTTSAIPGGIVYINGGSGGGNVTAGGAGGNVEIQPGSPPVGTTSAVTGGWLKLIGAYGNSGSGYPGTVYIRPGASGNVGGNITMTAGDGTNVNGVGGSLVFSGGQGTGAGQPGKVSFQTSTKIASGSGAQSYTERVYIDDTQMNVTFTTASSSTATGALVVGGGLGVAGNINGGNVSATNLTGTLATAAQTNITSVGTLSSLSVTGTVTAGNVSATNLTGTLATAAQTNITSVGTLSSLSVSGNVNAGNLITAGTSGIVSVNSITHTGTNATGNIGSSSSYFNTVFATAAAALYADVAEKYQADQHYDPGTVVIFGGDKEITQSTESHDSRIAGVISTEPAYLMNSGDSRDNSLSVALLGRVPCNVVGNIRKGDQLVSSTIPGVATKYNIDQYNPGMIIGKALADYNSDTPGVIEVVIGRL